MAGATLTQSLGVQTIYAPSTQSLPVIECGDKKGKKGEKRNVTAGDFDTEILISSSKSNSGLRDIGKLCPMFSGIWTLPGSSRQSEGAETFFPVCITNFYHLKALRSCLRDVNPNESWLTVVFHHLQYPCTLDPQILEINPQRHFSKALNQFFLLLIHYPSSHCNHWF